MKLFLSWSGEMSKQVAEALRDWIPSVIQAVQPWMSAEDIESGARWASAIEGQLKDSSAGVICMTPDNLVAPWVMFEAGAISKTVGATLVCPYLFRVEPQNLLGPLVQFQARRANAAETLKLLETLNETVTAPLAPEKLAHAFKVWWPQLEERLASIEGSSPKTPPRNHEEMLAEILNLVRDLVRAEKQLSGHRLFWNREPSRAAAEDYQFKVGGPRITRDPRPLVDWFVRNDSGDHAPIALTETQYEDLRERLKQQMEASLLVKATQLAEDHPPKE